jgi:hypothetical protein
LKQSVCRVERLRLISNESFTQQSVSSNTRSGVTLITGRKLLAMANSALSNIKKAMAHAIRFLGPELTLPSGQTEDDLDLYVLQKMHVDLNGKTSLDPDEQDNEDDKTRPGSDYDNLNGWTFNGWFAFKCFGPMAPSDYRIQFIGMGNKKASKCDGRAYARSECINDKDENFTATSNSASASRFRSRELVNAAVEKEATMIAQAEDSASQRYMEINTIRLTSLVQATTKEIDQSLELLKLELQGSLDWVKIKSEIMELRDNLKEYKTLLQANITQKRKTPDEVVKFLHTANSLNELKNKSSNKCSPQDDSELQEQAIPDGISSKRVHQDSISANKTNNEVSPEKSYAV